MRKVNSTAAAAQKLLSDARSAEKALLLPPDKSLPTPALFTAEYYCPVGVCSWTASELQKRYRYNDVEFTVVGGSDNAHSQPSSSAIDSAGDLFSGSRKSDHWRLGLDRSTGGPLFRRTAVTRAKSGRCISHAEITCRHVRKFTLRATKMTFHRRLDRRSDDGRTATRERPMARRPPLRRAPRRHH
ncbi:hypothetical protein EVAR_65682_1 [Eumeta japonica]|uniref:Uncharacterized protein n=1 Tax=Eumeta variegata TaxID=151549 RepID=A0A4C1Z9P2_EUMVA|nr:hypothetical protein EVAR_65682_1 [Eumeta japonica]